MRSSRKVSGSDDKLVAYEPLQSDCHGYMLINVNTAIRLFGSPVCGWCGNKCGIRAYKEGGLSA